MYFFIVLTERKIVSWRGTLAGCQVMVHQHLDGTLSITHGPHRLARYMADGTARIANKMSARKAGYS